MIRVLIDRYDLSKYASADEMKDAVLSDNSLSDMEKLYFIFQVSKDRLRDIDIQLYYAILGVIDSFKVPSPVAEGE